MIHSYRHFICVEVCAICGPFRRIVAASLLLVALIALPSAAQPPAREAVEAKNGMVVCVSPLAADVGVAALKAGAPSAKSNGDHKPRSLKAATRAASIQIERQLISEVLATTGGNRKRAASELGISYKALLYKLKQVQPAYHRNGVGL